MDEKDRDTIAINLRELCELIEASQRIVHTLEGIIHRKGLAGDEGDQHA